MGARNFSSACSNGRHAPAARETNRSRRGQSEKGGAGIANCARESGQGTGQGRRQKHRPELRNAQKLARHRHQHAVARPPEQARRHDVRPGLTGWAQVNGRNSISWEEKFNLDVWYVDNRSLFLDIKIFFLTVARVFRPKDINQPSKATVDRFMGNGKETNQDRDEI